MNRRNFIRQGTWVSLGFLSLQTYLTGCAEGSTGSAVTGGRPSGLTKSYYGPLKKDPAGILNLPRQLVQASFDECIADDVTVPTRFI